MDKDAKEKGIYQVGSGVRLMVADFLLNIYIIDNDDRKSMVHQVAKELCRLFYLKFYFV